MGIPREEGNDGWSAAPAGLVRWEAQGRTRGARQSVVRAASACAGADGTRLISEDAAPHDLQDADPSFQHLRDCVREYSNKLLFLGYSARSAAGMVLSAIRESVGDGNPHPVILRAAEEWALETSHTVPGEG
jgi:hypothetical protein